MCDRIKESNEFDTEDLATSEKQKMKLDQATSILAKTGCLEVNRQLSECMERNNRDWR
jgi:hypothetical protein